MVANPARDQLDRENEYFPVPVRQSRPASACLSPYQAESGAYLQDSSQFPRRRRETYGPVAIKID